MPFFYGTLLRCHPSTKTRFIAEPKNLVIGFVFCPPYFIRFQFINSIHLDLKMHKILSGTLSMLNRSLRPLILPKRGMYEEGVTLTPLNSPMEVRKNY
jgi:hypothetical protein